MSTASLARLLIADDESELVAALCRLLKVQGYSTVGVDSGEAALAALRAAIERNEPFDVLITDLMMPGMDGITLLRAAQEAEHDLVSIVMTGHGTIDTAVEAMKAGALDYILKPFNLSAVLPVLSRALAVRRLRLENTALLKRVADRTAELETTNRELQAANTELEAFTRSASHDLRNPLHAILGFAEFLIAEKAGALNAKQKEYLAEIHRSGAKLAKLTDDLLRFSRLGQQPLTKERVDVTHLVREILRDLQAAEPQRSVRLHLGSLPDVRADAALLTQAFVNLLSNAFKFTRRTPDPLIEITGYAEAGGCVYSIRDNGAGFDMAEAQKLFSIFHRLHSAEEFEGTGVGLSLVQRIVERHGGRISAEAAIGMGASFTLTLPAGAA